MQFINATSFANKILNRLEIRLKRIRLLSRPIELGIEPTLKCNSNCVMCNRNFSRRETNQADGLLSEAVFEKTRPFLRFAERVLFCGFGEPLLHPQYAEMLREIKRHGPYVYLFTNGLLLSKTIARDLVNAGADCISISMGGATRETYRRIRGVDGLETVVKNLAFLNDYKKRTGRKHPALAFNVVAMNSILPELVPLVQLAHELGVSEIRFPHLVVQGDAIRHESVWLNLKNAREAFSRAAVAASRLGIAFHPPMLEKSISSCTDLFQRLFVNWDGTVMSCSIERYLVGDLRCSEIGPVWNSPGLVRLRGRYFAEGLSSLCPSCNCWQNDPEIFFHPWVNSRESAERI